jgi:hypothetical protein
MILFVTWIEAPGHSRQHRQGTRQGTVPAGTAPGLSEGQIVGDFFSRD